MNKERVAVYMDGMEIVGNIFFQSPGQRMTDLLNEGNDRFLPMTDVKIFDKNGQLHNEDEFICVNKDLILLARRA